MKVAVSNDHRGHKAIEEIRAIISQLGMTCVDLSTPSDHPADYPDSAYIAARSVADHHADAAILVCGTGIGMSIAANKIKGIRAALCYDELAARLARQHNDANVLCLSGDLIGSNTLRKIVETFLTTDFVNGRHLRRVRKIQAIEEGKDPREITGQNSEFRIEN
ncbi:MAG TPA: ribose 5-phosphate isomerase B [Phycisphaerales bacterium]|nr:ribose 5-phosphate isomerase B [Phycisphaerales bacterium]